MEFIFKIMVYGWFGSGDYMNGFIVVIDDIENFIY